jgi:hypothetical protein
MTKLSDHSSVTAALISNRRPGPATNTWRASLAFLSDAGLRLGLENDIGYLVRYALSLPESALISSWYALKKRFASHVRHYMARHSEVTGVTAVEQQARREVEVAIDTLAAADCPSAEYDHVRDSAMSYTHEMEQHGRAAALAQELGWLQSHEAACPAS